MEKARWSAEQWDERFRQRMLQEQPPFDPTAWESMEAKLAAHQPQEEERVAPFWWWSAGGMPTRNGAWRYALAAAVGLFILVAAWWRLAQYQHQEDSTPAATALHKKQPTESTAPAMEVDAAQALVPEQQTAAVSKPLPQEATAAGTSRSGAVAGASVPAVREPLYTDQQVEEQAILSSGGTLGTAAQKAEEAQLLLAKSIMFQYQSLALGLPQPQAVPQAKATDAASAGVVVEKSKQRLVYKLSLTLTAVPDMSQAGALATTKPGFGGGLLLGYQLHRRLRLQAGALYVKKNYENDQGHTPYGSSYGARHAPTSVDASCAVLDLPLNLQYEVARGKSLRWYASAGVSSYLMVSERYTFQYPNYDRTYRYHNENRHWLGVLNAGVGVEVPLGQYLRVQAEPYFKLPLQGVGAETIRLTSFGLQFGLRYNL